MVVAIGFVSDAKSKMVALDRESKFPLLATSARSGAPWGRVSYTKLPNDFSASSCPLRVTAIEAAGKARSVMARCRIENAREKTLSWSSKAESKMPVAFRGWDWAGTAKA